MPERLTRQQIYDRIRAASKDSYILEEMQRLGFWEKSEIPTVSETLIKRETAINQELNKLLEQDRKYRNQDAMLKEMRKARMKKAKEKRELTKQQNTQKRLDKAARWKNAQLQQIIYLGKGISAGLNNTESDTELLNKYGLPIFDTLPDLVGSMNIDLSVLRYLSYQRQVSKNIHYHTFEIPKKSGGKRKISAPKKKLKTVQTWISETILDKVRPDDFVHGFVRERSILTNALPHVGQDIVINVDLKDFFPSIDYKRVKGLFRKFGYSEQLSIIFALLCTQAETKGVEMDGVTYHVQKGHRFLPQGSPASPAISNLIAYKSDRRIRGLASKLGFTYTRYADDLSFSTSKENEKNVGKLLHYLKEIISSEGFEVHPQKTYIMRSGGQQKVTGIVVNEKPNVERMKLRKFRALLHNLETNGWKDQKWGQAKNLIHAVEGYINFVKSVNSEKGKLFGEQLKRIIDKYGYPEIVQPVFVQAKSNELAVFGPEKKSEPVSKKSDNDWWNIFS